MSLPPDLTHEIAERTQQPGFDTVINRAGRARRRRRTTIASGLAAAVIVAGAAFAVGSQLAPDDRSPDPARPTPTTPWDGTSGVDPRLPADVQEILGKRGADVVDITATDDGAVAALWVACSTGREPHLDGCRSALVIRDGEDVHGLVVRGDPRDITPVPGGWLVAEETGPVRIDTEGRRTQVYAPGGNPAPPEAGDTFLPPAFGATLLRGDKLIPALVPAGSDLLSAYVTPSGRLVAATADADGISVSVTDDGRTWATQVPARVDGPLTTAGAVVAGSGNHVAVVFLGDSPDGSIPVTEVRASHDDGGSWTRTRGLDTSGRDRIRGLSSVAVMPDGTTYLTTGSHHLVRIDTGDNALPEQLSAFDRSMLALGDTACLVTEAGRLDQMRCGTAGGPWVAVPLPGLR